MDWHIEQVEQLFAATRTEFKHLEHFYFHNCLYEGVWKNNARRHSEKLATWDVLHTYPHDYKLIFVGDASMSPYEIVMDGGSVEHHNEESGKTWLERALNCWPHAVWLNPLPEAHWPYTQSIGMIQRIMEDRMFPLTLEGIEAAMKELTR
jgi:hypothetical protein